MGIYYMVEFAVFILSSLGFINIVVFSPLFSKFRVTVVNIFDYFGLKKHGEYLVKCPPCVGFWVGIPMTIFFLSGWVWLTLPLTVSFLGLVGQIYFFPEEIE